MKQHILKCIKCFLIFNDIDSSIKDYEIAEDRKSLTCTYNTGEKYCIYGEFYEQLSHFCSLMAGGFGLLHGELMGYGNV